MLSQRLINTRTVSTEKLRKEQLRAKSSIQGVITILPISWNWSEVESDTAWNTTTPLHSPSQLYPSSLSNTVVLAVVLDMFFLPQLKLGNPYSPLYNFIQWQNSSNIKETPPVVSKIQFLIITHVASGWSGNKI